MKKYEEEIEQLRIEIKGLKDLLTLKEAVIEKLKNTNESMSVKVFEHKTIIDEEQEKTFPCEKCNFTFDSNLDFEKHLQGIQHNIPVKDDLEYSFSDEEEDDSFREMCCLCKKVFTNFENLDDHQSNYIRCDKCAICYHNEFEFKKHENCEY